MLGVQKGGMVVVEVCTRVFGKDASILDMINITLSLLCFGPESLVALLSKLMLAVGVGKVTTFNIPLNVKGGP